MTGRSIQKVLIEPFLTDLDNGEQAYVLTYLCLKFYPSLQPFSRIPPGYEPPPNSMVSHLVELCETTLPKNLTLFVDLLVSMGRLVPASDTQAEPISAQNGEVADSAIIPVDVFISYSRADREFVFKLIADLQARQISYWIDERIEYGELWWEVIAAQIVACRYFVVVMSPKSAASKWVSREIHVADHHNKEFRPILLHGEPFPMFLGSHCADVAANGALKPDFLDTLEPREG